MTHVKTTAIVVYKPAKPQVAVGMTRLQAEEHTARIKWHTAAAREHIRRIYELEGWRAIWGIASPV